MSLPDIEIRLWKSSDSESETAVGAKVLIDGAVLPGVRDVSVRYEPGGPAHVTVTFTARRVRIKPAEAL